jgi:hypothetical protein
MVNYKSIIKELQKDYSDAANVAITDTSGKVLYSTENWNIEGDIKGVLSSWASNSAQFVLMNGIRYSILQMEPERFIATNRDNKGHLIGACCPDGSKYVLAHIKPKAKGWYHLAYPTLARAAAMMTKVTKSKSFGPQIDKETNPDNVQNDLNDDYSLSGGSVVSVLAEKPQIEPSLKIEIEQFLDWINDPQGFSGYISYFLQQNDQKVISALAVIYKILHRICRT